MVTSSNTHTFFGREIESSKWVRNCRNSQKREGILGVKSPMWSWNN
jgi:hypothetical protein